MHNCANCRYAQEIPWGKGDKDTAVRCMDAGSYHKGFVTEIYPAGHPGVVANRQPPEWCRFMEVGENAAE